MRIKKKPLFLASAAVGAAVALVLFVRWGRELPPQGLADGPAGVAGATEQLVVDLKDGTPLSALAERLPGASARWVCEDVSDEAIAVVSVPRAEQAAVLERLARDPLVEMAEPNQLYQIEPWELLDSAGLEDEIPDDRKFDPRAEYPNDPLYDRQWHMEMVRAREAWDFATGKGVIVAVIDTGVAYEDHKGLFAPDLQRTRFVPGWDFVGNDAIAADDHGHGTHCAGTIAQSTHNDIGVAGLAPDCKIMPLKVLTAGGWGTTADIAAAIRFAADHGAHVLSLSLGGGGYSRVLASAVAYAHSKGCAVVCAAGNGGRARVEYPAAYPGAMAVSSVGRQGKLAFYSSYGPEVFIAAPGGDKSEGAKGGVLQNTLDHKRPGKTIYASWQGTSMATPHVAAACALLYELGVTSPEAQREVLTATASAPKDPSWKGGRSDRYGAGVLDAGAAVRHVMLTPALISLGLAGLFLFGAIRVTRGADLGRGLLIGAAAFAAAGVPIMALRGVPLVGPFLTRSPATWDLLLFGPGWHWSPLFASALIPGFLAFVSLKSRFTRSLGCGLALGWAARLFTGALVPLADVRWVPGHGLLDALWLTGNAAALLVLVAVVVRLGRGKEGLAC